MSEQQYDFTPTNAENVEVVGETYLLYAPPGVGKTTTIKYLPGKTLLIDFDRTSHVLKGHSNIDIVYGSNTDTWDWLEAWSIHAEKNVKGKYDNIVIDNVSEMERCILASLGDKGKNNGVPSQGDYQYMQFKIVKMFRWMKTLAKRVVFLAWETVDLFTDASGNNYNRAYPQINMKIMANVLGLCHIVGRLTVKTDGSRGYILSATNSVYAKNQLDSRAGCLQSEIFVIGAPSTDDEKGEN